MPKFIELTNTDGESILFNANNIATVETAQSYHGDANSVIRCVGMPQSSYKVVEFYTAIQGDLNDE